MKLLECHYAGSLKLIWVYTWKLNEDILSLYTRETILLNCSNVKATNRLANWWRFGSLTKMPELLFVFLEKCLTLVLVHFCSLMLDIDDTLKQKGNTVLKSWTEHSPSICSFCNVVWQTCLIKNIPTSSKYRTAAGFLNSQQALLAAPLLLIVRELCGAGLSPSTLLLQRLRAVDS